MSQPPRGLHAIVRTLLFLSGMAGLVYEIVWARYLALFLGHTSYAVVMVLVAFMGGLAIGNFWLGRLADRSKAPLAFYGWLEIGVAAYGFLFPLYYSLCHRAFVALAQGMEPGSSTLLILKLCFSLLAILLPTILMGGTLPVLAKFVTRSLAELRDQVAVLYAVNSAGAVAGCLVADFWLIPRTGLPGTVWVAAVINLLVGSVALGMQAWLKQRPEPAAVEPAATIAERFTPVEMRLALVAIGVSGLVAMLYEVAWTRFLALALGSSTHAFSLMLVTFIAGITAGSWLVARWTTLRRTLNVFAWAEIALAVTLLGSMFAYSSLPVWFVMLASLLARRPEAYPLYELLQASICFGVMFVPTMFLGMTLPLASRVATQELTDTGRSVGRVFAVNTLGTVLGTLLTGFWLMPFLGLARTLALGATVNALLGIAILGRHRFFATSRSTIRLPVVAISVMASFALMWLAGVLSKSWPQALTLGLWRLESLPFNAAEIRKKIHRYDFVYHRDGAGSTVTVVKYLQEDQPHMSLMVNGKADASTAGDMPTQLLLGHLPMLLRPASERALVVGLGSGCTAGAITTHPTLKQLDVVEISPEVIQAARLFRSYNGRVLDDPRVRILVEDAKTFLQITPHTYDVIVSEPSNPWMAGVAGVFSREFYEACRARLRGDGLMVQWMHLSHISDEAVDVVLRTFTSVFPHTSVWQPARTDLILIGSSQPWKPDLAAFVARFHHPAVKEDLERIEVTRVPVLLAREVISQENAVHVASLDTPMHSDLRPVLEYIAQKDFFVAAKANRWRIFNELGTPRATTLLAQYTKEHPLNVDDFKAFMDHYFTRKFPETVLFRSLLFRWERDVSGATEPIQLAAQLDEPDPSPEALVQKLAQIRTSMFKLATEDASLLNRYRNYLFQVYLTHRSFFYVPSNQELIAVLKRLIEADPTNQRVYKLELASLAWDVRDDDALLRLGYGVFSSETAGAKRFDLDPDVVPAVMSYMAEAQLQQGNLKEAKRICELATTLKQSSPLLEMTRRKVQSQADSMPPHASAPQK